MYNKYTTTLYAAVTASVLVVSLFAVSYVQQQALAQGNQTAGAAGDTNQSGGNSTSGGATTSGSATTGTTHGNRY